MKTHRFVWRLLAENRLNSGRDFVAFDSTSTCSIELPIITLVCPPEKNTLENGKKTLFLQEKRVRLGRWVLGFLPDI